MLKHIALFCLIVLVTLSGNADASTKKKKKKSRAQTSARTRTHKVSKYARKSRRFHHGTGPDLKSITTDSPYPYTEDPNNGVTPVETKQP
ncbi:MAG: hypothetical protein PHY93_11630 [Bacteriovorax sp.]|nr:hypothetical protein [Bacteriovorax sp.]